MERRKFIQASVAGAVAAPAVVKAQAGRQVEDAVDVELGRAHLQGLRGPLHPHQQALRRQARDHAVRRRRRHRRVRDARCRQRRRAAGPCLVGRLLLRQGSRPRRDQRLRLRLPASVAGRGLVLPEGRPRHAARGLCQVQRLPGRRELVGRRVDRRQEADQEHGRLQGREVPLAAGHDGRDPDQARRLDRRPAGRRGLLRARQGRGRRRRLGDRLDEPAHGLPRGRQVPADHRPLDAGAGVHRQPRDLEGAARRRQAAGHRRRARSGPGIRSSASRSTTSAS